MPSMVKGNKKDYTTLTKENTDMAKNCKENCNGVKIMKNTLMKELLMSMTNFKDTVYIY